MPKKAGGKRGPVTAQVSSVDAVAQEGPESPTAALAELDAIDLGSSGVGRPAVTSTELQSDASATFDVEGADPSLDFANPLASSKNGGKSPTIAEKIAANEEELTEAELDDLTCAFQAADMDGGGAISLGEFELMLSVMGSTVDSSEASRLMDEAKQGFAAWLKMADEANVEKCARIWADYDIDKSGSMDLAEINNVIAALRNLGSHIEPLGEAQFNRLSSADSGQLSVEEFTAWYLNQEGLPSDFYLRTTDQVALRELKTPGTIERLAGQGLGAAGTVLSPLAGLSKKVVAGPSELLKMSGKLVKQGAELGLKTGGAVLRNVAGQHSNETGDGEAGQLALQVADSTNLTFAELVFMMRSGALQKLLPTDWKTSVSVMRRLREAFDTVDVNGDHQLTFEELEMVIVAINPNVSITHDDLMELWRVLNPLGDEWITFAAYAEGMVRTQQIPELQRMVPVELPNRFALLSLLIDSPINHEQQKQLFEQMGFLEKSGIKLLEGMGSVPLSKEQTRKTLDQACAGKLHYLTDQQRKAVKSLHTACVLQACMIACVTCGCAGLWENFLVLEYETDGVKWAYWTCNDVVADVSSPDSVYSNLSLPLNPRAWSSNAPSFGDWDRSVPYSGRCIPGTCAAFPLNVTLYREMGGNYRMGGNWTPQMDLWEGECVPLGTPDPQRLLRFFILNISMVVLMIILELSGLMLTALRSAVKVSKALDLRLTPLNTQRAFVANMLVRSVFELGDAEGTVLGVDASADGEEEEESGGLWNTIKNILAVVWIKGKVILTGAAFKALTARHTNSDTATFLKPYSGTMFATMLWDTLMCHAIMKGAEMKAIGVTTAVECFNDVMDTFCPLFENDPSTLSDIARVQILRAIGVAIVKHGSMFPTMEILLRHAVDYLNMKSSTAVRYGGIIDNAEAFVEDFKAITLDESRAVLCIHMLCYVLDGAISIRELMFWSKLLKRVDDLYQEDQAKLAGLTAAELRDWIVLQKPGLKIAVSRIPQDVNGAGGNWRNDRGSTEMEELRQLALQVPSPKNVTRLDQLIPRVICQKFRAVSSIQLYTLVSSTPHRFVLPPCNRTMNR